MLLFMAFASCTKEKTEKKDVWVEIDSIMPSQGISDKLNSIFLDSWNKNECLKISYRAKLYSVNSMEEYQKIDTCNTIPEIDFNKYTLTLGGFSVPSAYYKIWDIKLFGNEAKASYRYEISMDTCAYCYAVFGYKYFWRLYPKLHSDYQFELSIKNTN
jgi:hypothetical protein